MTSGVGHHCYASTTPVHQILGSHPRPWQHMMAIRPSLPAETLNSSFGNSLSLCCGEIDLGSQLPRHEEQRFPLGGGLVWTVRFRDSSDRAGALSCSSNDTAEAADVDSAELELVHEQDCWDSRESDSDVAIASVTCMSGSKVHIAHPNACTNGGRAAHHTPHAQLCSKLCLC